MQDLVANMPPRISNVPSIMRMTSSSDFRRTLPPYDLSFPRPKNIAGEYEFVYAERGHMYCIDSMGNRLRMYNRNYHQPIPGGLPYFEVTDRIKNSPTYRKDFFFAEIGDKVYHLVVSDSNRGYDLLEFQESDHGDNLYNPSRTTYCRDPVLQAQHHKKFIYSLYPDMSRENEKVKPVTLAQSPAEYDQLKKQRSMDFNGYPTLYYGLIRYGPYGERKFVYDVRTQTMHYFSKDTEEHPEVGRSEALCNKRMDNCASCGSTSGAACQWLGSLGMAFKIASL